MGSRLPPPLEDELLDELELDDELLLELELDDELLLELELDDELLLEFGVLLPLSLEPPQADKIRSDSVIHE